MQKVVLLGSTGSVGKSSLEVIEKNKEKYEDYIRKMYEKYMKIIKQNVVQNIHACM